MPAHSDYLRVPREHKLEILAMFITLVNDRSTSGYSNEIMGVKVDILFSASPPPKKTDPI